MGYNLETPHLRPSIIQPSGRLIDCNVSGFAGQTRNTYEKDEKKRSEKAEEDFSFLLEKKLSLQRREAISLIFSSKLPKSLLHLSFVIGSYVYWELEVDFFQSLPDLLFDHGFTFDPRSGR